MKKITALLVVLIIIVLTVALFLVWRSKKDSFLQSEREIYTPAGFVPQGGGRGGLDASVEESW